MSVTPVGLKSEGIAFVKAVWMMQPEGFFLLRIRHLDGRWSKLWLSHKQVKKLEDVKFPPDVDIYFSPVAYSRPRALKVNVLPSRWLFADLDYVMPTEVPIIPDAAWETSPGKWQAIWFLQHAVEPEEFRHLNRAICHACGADPGTWNTNRLLRVPGTENVKRLRRAA